MQHSRLQKILKMANIERTIIGLKHEMTVHATDMFLKEKISNVKKFYHSIEGDDLSLKLGRYKIQ